MRNLMKLFGWGLLGGFGAATEWGQRIEDNVVETARMSGEASAEAVVEQILQNEKTRKWRDSLKDDVLREVEEERQGMRNHEEMLRDFSGEKELYNRLIDERESVTERAAKHVNQAENEAQALMDFLDEEERLDALQFDLNRQYNY